MFDAATTFPRYQSEVPPVMGCSIFQAPFMRVFDRAIGSVGEVDHTGANRVAVDRRVRRSGRPVDLPVCMGANDDWLLHARMLGGVLSGSCVHRVKNS